MCNQVQSISRDGFTLKYFIRGKGPHAFVIGSHLYYPRVFSPDLEESFKLVYVDHRGFAPKQSPAIESDFSLDKILEDIECLRLKLNQKKITLIGHSIHALIALQYAKKHPDHVDKIVLSASSPIAGKKLFFEANKHFEDSAEPHRKQLLAFAMGTLDQEIEQNPDQAFVIRMLKLAPMLWYDPNFDASFLWKDVRLDPLGSDIIWNKLFQDYEIPDMRELDLPVLLLLGRHDYFNPPHLWESHSSKFQNLTVRIFEKSGHTPSYEEADDFNSAVLHWLNHDPREAIHTC